MDATLRTVMWKKKDRQRFGNKGLNTAANHQLVDHNDGVTWCGESVPAENEGFAITRGDPVVTCIRCLERRPPLAERMRRRKVRTPRLTHDSIAAQIRNFQSQGGIIQRLPEESGLRSGMVRVDDFRSNMRKTRGS